MKFSVVIPLYNKAPFIGCTLDSVLAQRWSDLEVVVVDDGSSDPGPDIVAARARTDRRVRLIRQTNAGVSVARNRGIAEARGQWVAFLDADDWWHPDLLSTLVELAQACPEAETLACDLAFVPHDDQHWPPAWSVPQGPLPIEVIDCLPRRWMQGPTLSSSSTAVRRDRLLQMQPCFPPGETQGEDLDLWFRLAEAAPVAMVHRPLAAYRIELAGSLSSRHEVHELAPFLHRLRDRALDGRMRRDWRQATLVFVAHHQLTHARLHLGRGRRLRAWQLLWQARHALRSRRWWGTAVLGLLPAAWSRQIQRWREGRGRTALALAETN